MCTLTEPAPGIVIDFLHPNSVWLFPALTLVVAVVLLVRLRRSLPGKDAGLSVQYAWRLAIVACLCLLLAAATVAFVAYPTDAAQKAWIAREEAALPASCIDTVIEPAASAASAPFYFVWWGLVILPFLLGVLMFNAALRGRGLTWR